MEWTLVTASAVELVARLGGNAVELKVVYLVVTKAYMLEFDLVGMMVAMWAYSHQVGELEKRKADNLAALMVEWMVSRWDYSKVVWWVGCLDF